MLDDIDLQILDLLQENARIQNAEVARRVGLTPPAVLERIRKLEKRGAVKGFHARLDPAQLDCPMLAFVFVKTDENASEQGAALALAALPEVQEVHHVAGEDCYLAKVRVPGPKALGRLIREQFGRIPTVVSTRSTVVLETVKEDPRLPLRPRKGESDA